jgi:formylglycine-generating enzyme required for sulfatase activity
MRSRFVRRSILISALIVFMGLLSFHASWLSIAGTTSAQDPNATLPSKEKTAPAKKTTPPPKKSTPRKRANSGNASADEIAFWASIKDSTDPEDFKAYVQQYPNGKFVALAKNKLKALEAAKSSPSPSTTSPSTTNSSSSSLLRTRTNQAGIEFVLIPPGNFMMGSTNGGDNEKPVHQVTISQAFYIGKYEVTQAQWQSVMGNNPSNFKDCGGNCPVEQVSWDDAQNFVNKLNESNDGFRYRLPTEAEWEYACRAGTTGDYAGNLGEMAWYLENSDLKTHAVGGKQRNAWGLADMHGNVWEWCQDWYHDTYYGAPIDGSAWLSGGEQKYRVMRGGSWVSKAFDTRSANRDWLRPANRDWDPLVRDNVIGFRVVAVPRSDSNPTDSRSSNTAKPPNPPLPLHSFDFVTVTLDSSGKLKSRETKSANAYVEDLGGGVKLEMVAIPPGEFMMGSPETEAGRIKDEGPQHRVRVNYWSYVGKFEVTQAEWRAIMGTNPSYFIIGTNSSNFKDCDDCPVEKVSWDDAVEFCRKLSARTGREYRLPSEAEWEYAARAGTMTPFAFGDTITPEIVNYNGEKPYGNAAKGTNRQKTVAVGSLGVANAFGLYDMHGNVWEWCQDWYHDSYSAIAGDGPADGSAWVTGGEQKYRVLRGGSWSDYATSTRSAVRLNNYPVTSIPSFGFRVVAVR